MSTVPFKDNLMTALRSAVQTFNDSNDPDQAVVKAAQAFDFNAEQTTRLVEMFNTARTLYHYKSAADRTATFKLADPDKVLPAIFDTSSTVAEKAASLHDYSDYGRREIDFHADSLTKTAGDLPGPQDAGLSETAVAAQAMKAVRTLRQMSKIASDEARIAANTASRLIEKTARMFSLGIDHGKMADQYARLMVGFSKDAEWVPVMVKLSAVIPKKDHAPEALMVKYSSMAVIDDRDLEPQLTLLKEAREWMEIEAEMLTAAGQFDKEANEFEREYVEITMPFFRDTAVTGLAGFLRPELVKAAQTVSESKYKTRNMYGEPVDVTEKKEQGGTPQSGGMMDAIGGMASESVKKPLTSFLETGVERAFTGQQGRDNKALSERLKNVQRQIMLQDLMVNDPVLSEETPESVAQAYDAVLQMAPEVAANKEVVRAILRQTVHSVAISPYDADVWTKLEGNLRNIRGKGTPTPQQQGGGKR